jgi:hypothetical protein
MTDSASVDLVRSIFPDPEPALAQYPQLRKSIKMVDHAEGQHGHRLPCW